MKKRFVPLIIFAIIISILTGCSKSEEEVLEDVKGTAQTSFDDENIESNTDTETFSFYLPRGYEITEETKSNLLLNKGDQTIILFYNALESTTSNLNYQAAEAAGNYILLKSYEDDDRFGYVLVKAFESEEEESYELQIGVGGVKITTITTKGELVQDTEEMMQMANSIAYGSATETIAQ
ncbi:hypothetical protein [Radiobacillus sp. PE A8.2]|uniref:hypothetical protein n=1 Tax=Radiobacillus sp. PE A8.2 TaxID=3380349 RepID=UPI00388E6C4A